MTDNDPSRPPILCEPIRCVLVGFPATEEPAETPALSHSIAFAQACRAALSLYVFAPQLRQPLPMSTATASVWLGEEAKRLERLAEATTRFTSELISRAGLEVIAEHSHSPFEARSERFVQLARIHDVTVLDAGDGPNTAQQAMIEDTLFDSGKPLLVVPRHGGTATPQRIAIAWDGSARSARAVKDALPILAAAQTVVAVTVEGEKDLSRMAPGADLATYLVRHGIDCKLATLTARQRDVAERLRLFVNEEEIEMIVMGAFVHSRFRQAILGGVTQSLLDKPPVTLFLAH